MTFTRTTAIVALSAGLFCASATAENPSAATQPAGAASASTQPTATPKIAATIGETRIPAADIERILKVKMSRMPTKMREALTDKQIASARKQILDQLIQTALLQAHLKTLDCTEKELAKLKKELSDELKRRGLTVTLEEAMRLQGLTDELLREQIKLRRLQEQAVSKEKIAAFLKASPVSYLDGTIVQASHILIRCDLYASPAEKVKARQKLQKIAKQIQAGKVTFADAAKQNSNCPSSAKGGDLGEFTFDKMVLPFSRAAFGMKVGQVSGIVESHFGFHLIKATKRTDGSKHPGAGAEQIARKTLGSQLQEDILHKALAKNPVVVAE